MAELNAALYPVTKANTPSPRRPLTILIIVNTIKFSTGLRFEEISETLYYIETIFTGRNGAITFGPSAVQNWHQSYYTISKIFKGTNRK